MKKGERQPAQVTSFNPCQVDRIISPNCFQGSIDYLSANLRILKCKAVSSLQFYNDKVSGISVSKKRVQLQTLCPLQVTLPFSGIRSSGKHCLPHRTTATFQVSWSSFHFSNTKGLIVHMHLGLFNEDDFDKRKVGFPVRCTYSLRKGLRNQDPAMIV